MATTLTYDNSQMPPSKYKQRFQFGIAKTPD